ncbi:tRNA(His) guanylyltransferase, putative [Babesia caballi]|uniref:tRNA(His) guanylyltransferase, putative n=1 Tax=Babesia caballi TaxID=5871 RepID=A0AAV4M2W1_BABCB|nr:tRNA(His) guanylyltransferase, putative [Babesia caballi]
MAAVREYLVYGVNDTHKHRWPIHYHLLRNDFVAAIETIKRGANPLVTDEHGASALALCCELFFRTINKCLNSTAPLGTRRQRQGVKPPPQQVKPKRRVPLGAPELHGMADYALSGEPSIKEEKPVDSPLFTSYVEFVIGNHGIEDASLKQQALLRRARGLLAVLRVISELDGMLLHSKDVLMRSIGAMQYPTLYASVMDYLFHHCKTYGSPNADAADVWHARCLWRAAASKDRKLLALTGFLTHIAAVLEELCAIFHVDIYNKSLAAFAVLYPGHDRRLRLPGIDAETTEVLAHMAFVTNRSLLFDAMVLQDSFLRPGGAFNWTDLLSHLLGGVGQLRSFAEPLMRRKLRHNVEGHIRYPGTVEYGADF